MMTPATPCNFDTVIERRGSGALKTDALRERFGRDGLMPLWVADMDFPTPPFIIDALRRRLDHPVLGYTVEPADWRPAVTHWLRRRHGLEVRPEWLAYIPGIVKGIGMAVNVFTGPGDAVVIQPPVYHPFRMVAEGNGRRVVANPLVERRDGLYDMDLDGLERLLDAEPRARMLVLSNPHNPGGVVWPAATLQRLATICRSRGVLVVSDEIHADMALFGHTHTPFLAAGPDAAACSITFGAPSKTFNIAGVVSSYAIVPDAGLRGRFYGWLEANELWEPDIFAPIATIAAYRHGEEWLGEMLAYVEANVGEVERLCRELMGGRVRAVRPEASFLVWLDCRGLGLGQRELVELFVGRAGLALNDGSMFGPGGEGHMRLNVGCPRSLLVEAMHRLARAIEEAGLAENG